jgi:hypothetical protein
MGSGGMTDDSDFEAGSGDWCAASSWPLVKNISVWEIVEGGTSESVTSSGCDITTDGGKLADGNTFADGEKSTAAGTLVTVGILAEFSSIVDDGTGAAADFPEVVRRKENLESFLRSDMG